MLRLVILTQHPYLHTPRRLAAAARDLGVAVELREPRPWALARRHDPRPPHDVADALVLARPGTFSLVRVLVELRRLERGGARLLQARRSLLDACDQWRTLVQLHQAAIATPPTWLVRRADELTTALATIEGPPWFLKGRRGSQGTQVVLASTRAEALALGHRFWGSGASCLVQADLRPRGRIERHLVVRGELVASAIAHAAPGEFRTNIHRGGRFAAIDARAACAAELARRAVRAIGLPLAAVDTIGEEEPAVLDVNASPGIEALEAATGRDLAREIVARLLTADYARHA